MRLSIALLALLLFALPAQAATVSYVDGTLSVVAAAGEETGPQFYFSDGKYLVTRGVFQTGQGCALDAFRNAMCTAKDDRARIELDFGAGRALLLRADPFPYSSSLIRGGARDDLLVLGGGPDEIHGGAGNDQLEGLAGDDRLYGDEGDDAFIAGPGADVYDGGPGRDTLQYDNPDPTAPQVAVSVYLDDGANDGAPREGDDVKGIEQVITGDEQDLLVGSDVAEWLYAGGGVDIVKGGGGDDYLAPNGGTVAYSGGRVVRSPRVEKDMVDAGAGNDIVWDIEADGTRQTDQLVDDISCGEGRDTVITGMPAGSALKRLGSDCEVACANIHAFCRERGIAPAKFLGSRRLRGGRVAILCPRARRGRRCRGTVDLRRGPKLVASRSYSLRPGQRRRVRMGVVGGDYQAVLIGREGIIAVRHVVVP